MFTTSFICFYLSIIFVALPHVASSTLVNKTTADGKVFITGDHNEVVVSTAQETKKALAEIERKINSMKEKDKKFYEQILSLNNKTQSLEKRMGIKLDLMNKSNAALSAQVQAMVQRLTTLEKQEKLKAMNQNVKALSQTVNQSNAALTAQVQAMSQRLTTLEKQVGAGYALLFPRKGTNDYVMARGMPSLKAVTFCLWMKTADTGNAGTPLSYAVSGSTNELLLLDYRNFDLYLGSSRSGYTSVSANDGKWHHICYAWENTTGSWKLYKDGTIAASGKNLKTGRRIRGGGVLVLGQDQDSVAGSFDANQSFMGEMTGVNIWDHVVKDQEIMRMSKSCLTGEGNVFQWRDFKTHVKGSVKIINRSC